MYSKFTKIGFGIALSLVLTSCNLPINDAPPAPSDINAKLDGSQCLESAMGSMSHFVKGIASPNEVIGFWDCLASAVSSFEKSTRGRYEDRFTALELTNFVERYFMSPGEKISPSLRLEIFKIKQLLVGGPDDAISRVEMKNAISVLSDLKMICLHLNPYMKVYSLNWSVSPIQDMDENIKYFDNANLEIQQAAKDFSDIITKNGQSYHLENFVLLLRELEKFDSTPWTWLSDVDKAMPLVEKLKQTLAGGAGGDVLPTEWRRFFLLSFRGYIQYLRYHYFIDVPHGSTSQMLVYVTRSIDDLFSYLGDMVEGKEEKTLTRQELLEILQALAQFVPKLNIEDSLLVEVMKIKAILFGGRIDYFEKADFDRAREKLENFRKLAEQFLEYRDVYTLGWKTAGLTPEDKAARFSRAEESLRAFGGKLGENIEGKYDLRDLVKLAKEIDHFLGDKEENKPSLQENAEKFVPIIIAAKNIIFTDSDSMVGSAAKAMARAAWKDFLGLSADGYNRYLYYYYFVKGQPITKGEGIYDIEKLVRDFAVYVDKILSKKTASQEQITYAELNQLLAAIAQAGILPEHMTAESLSKVVVAVCDKILRTPENRLAGTKTLGLSHENMEVLRNEFAIWAGVQRFNEWLYKGVPDETGRPNYQVIAALGPADSPGLKELKLIYDSPMDVTIDSSGRMPLYRPGYSFYLRDTADYINLVRAGIRLAIRGYAGDMNRITNYQGLKEAEVKALFADFKDLVIEMGLISPSNTTFAEARFRDGNLFTSNSNGDDYLSFKEATHLIMMITSGLKIDSMFYAEVEKNCPIENNSRFKDDWTVEYKCLTPIYLSRMEENFSSMPDLIYFMKHMSAEQKQNFYANIMKASGYDPVLGSKVKMKDLSQFPHVAQYVEMIFQLFDKNRDGFLNTEEALKAFPTYKNILLQAAKGKVKKEKDLKGLFTWLLKYGKPPEGLWKSLKFLLVWVPKGEKGWVVSADREKLATILGFIGEETAKLEREGGGAAAVGGDVSADPAAVVTP